MHPHSCEDVKSHYGVIIMGAGLSGLAAAIQLKRVLKFPGEEIIVYEKDQEIGGTWQKNVYPGAGCDIPIALYSYSFARSAEFTSQWALQSEILRYLRWVRAKFNINNIRFGTHVDEARWSDETGLWTLVITDLATGVKSVKTCSVLISAVGGLTIPSIPTFPGQDKFTGDIFHSAQWRQDVEIKGKDVVVIGNGCSACQIVPTIAPEVKSLTQIARSRQSVLRRPPVPEFAVLTFLLRYVPGVLFCFRAAVFFIAESFFKISDIKRGASMRKSLLKDTISYTEEIAPKRYWDMLKPDFDLGAKRRIFDSGYLASLHSENVELIHDGIKEFKAQSVVTESGREIPADVVVMSTGFRVQEFLFPLNIINGKGESLRDRFKSTNVSNYQATCYHDFPNLFTLMGANSATGHSSVIFTSECQINLILRLVKPILAKLTSDAKIVGPSPSVTVKAESEAAYMVKLRSEMKKKVWEKDGGVSWYVDKATGLCTTLYPWSQVHFWWASRTAPMSAFNRIGC